MSLEAALVDNTTAIRELIATLTAQATAAGPAVQAVVQAQKAADAKKSNPAPAATRTTAPAASAPSGAPSTPTTESSSGAPKSLRAWHEKTAPDYEKLKDAPASLDTIRTAILAINAKIGREQAIAVLGRFGAEVVAPKPDKRALDPTHYAEAFALCLDVLAGRADALDAIAEAA